jgi:hypothetical protein
VRRDNIDREPSMSQLTEKTIFDQHCISARTLSLDRSPPGRWLLSMIENGEPEESQVHKPRKRAQVISAWGTSNTESDRRAIYKQHRWR